jgi:hypothetical protein
VSDRGGCKYFGRGETVKLYNRYLHRWSCMNLSTNPSWTDWRRNRSHYGKDFCKIVNTCKTDLRLFLSCLTENFCTLLLGVLTAVITAWSSGFYPRVTLSPTFRRNISPLASESNSKQRKNQQKQELISANFLLGILFDFEDGSYMFLRNFGVPPSCMALQLFYTLRQKCLSH